MIPKDWESFSFGDVHSKEDWKNTFKKIKTALFSVGLKEIIIYSGITKDDELPGDDVTHLIKLIKELDILIRTVNAAEFKPLTWNSVTTAVVIPGIKSRDLDSQLGESKKEELKQYLDSGGHFYGLCGAAYWGCRSISYKCYDDTFIKKMGNLDFFSGEGKGPVIPNTSKEHRNDYYTTPIELELLTPKYKKIVIGLVIGGGSFVSPSDSEISSTDCISLMRYVKTIDRDTTIDSELSNAVVKCKVGKGVAILSFPYFCYGKKDILVEQFSKLLPGHNWEKIHQSLLNTKWQRYSCFAFQLLQLMHPFS